MKLVKQKGPKFCDMSGTIKVRTHENIIESKFIYDSKAKQT